MPSIFRTGFSLEYGLSWLILDKVAIGSISISYSFSNTRTDKHAFDTGIKYLPLPFGMSLHSKEHSWMAIRHGMFPFKAVSSHTLKGISINVRFPSVCMIEVKRYTIMIPPFIFSAIQIQVGQLFDMLELA